MGIWETESTPGQLRAPGKARFFQRYGSRFHKFPIR